MRSVGITGWKRYGLLLLAVSVIFLWLYGPCIFGGKLYAYSDIGADTVDQYLPVMVYELDRLGESGYDLQYGLGDYVPDPLYKYLTPFDAPIALLGGEHLAAGILISTYIKYCLIAAAALYFFTRLLGEEKTAFLCALLWTYSGYALLWGQHYRFLTVILAFTLAICAMQLFLEEDRKKFLLIPGLAALAGTSYYFLYTSCFFFAPYGVLYLWYHGKKPLEILKKVGWFALAMAAAACLGGIYLLPAVADFFDSARVAEVTGGAGQSGLLYAPSYILCLLGRLLSTDILGSGSLYRGPTNYYEMAILSVSMLGLLSIFLLLTGKYRLRTFLITGGALLLLCMPGFSRIIVFSELNQRWTYLLCFAQVIAIGFGLRELLGKETSGLARRGLAVLGTFGFIACVLGVMWLWFHRAGVLLDLGACGRVAVFAFLYGLIFLFVGKLPHSGKVLAVVIAAELMICGTQTVSGRQLVDLETWNTGMYYDGTREVVQELSAADGGVYRVNKTYDSVRQNDALIQGYNGLGVYLSTNSQELVELFQRFGYPLMLGERTNWIRFDGDDLAANVLLGSKYVISREEMDPRFYRELEGAGDLRVYALRYHPGFGYLQTQTVSEGQTEKATRLERLLLLCRGYYRTGQGSGEAISTDAAAEQLTLSKTEDGSILMIWPEETPNRIPSGIRLTLTEPVGGDIRLYRADGTLLDQVYLGADRRECVLDVASWEQGTTLEGVSPETVANAELIWMDAQTLIGSLEQLRLRGVTDWEETSDGFFLQLDTPSDAMLCTALIYSNRWQAWVDGAEVSCVNVNGGLLGIPVTAGSHSIELVCRDPWSAWGTALSIVSVAVYCLGFVLWQRRKKRRI